MLVNTSEINSIQFNQYLKHTKNKVQCGATFCLEGSIVDTNCFLHLEHKTCVIMAFKHDDVIFQFGCI